MLSSGVLDGPGLAGHRSGSGLGGGSGSGSRSGNASSNNNNTQPKKKARRGTDSASQKRRCVSTACIACRKRKSKCDGALPSCAACASVYGTECVYDPNSDHRRKGVYREKIDSMKARNSTLQVLIEAILNADEEDVPAIVKQIRTCDSLDVVAEAILRRDYGPGAGGEDDGEDEDEIVDDEYPINQPIEGERDLARKMGELRIENGSVRFIGGTSHLIYLDDPASAPDEPESDSYLSTEDPIISWSEVTKDPQLVIHLINMYFAWHYPYFTTLSKTLFYRDFLRGKPTGQPRSTVYCSPLLVHAMLALGCHFTSIAGAFAIPGDSRTKGDHFFAEAKRLIVENDEYEKPRLTTVQALALMSVREAGCGREAKGWVYSGMSFRMAQDIGLNLDIAGRGKGSLSEQEVMLEGSLSGAVSFSTSVGQTTSDDYHNFPRTAITFQNTTFSRTRMPSCGRHTLTVGSINHLSNLQGQGRRAYNCPSSARSAAIYCSFSTTRTTLDGQAASRLSLRSSASCTADWRTGRRSCRRNSSQRTDSSPVSYLHSANPFPKMMHQVISNLLTACSTISNISTSSDPFSNMHPPHLPFRHTFHLDEYAPPTRAPSLS